MQANSALPPLEDYQRRFVANVRRIIETNWLRKRPAIRILDMGCDTSGRQIAHLATLTSGEVTGINISDDFPSPTAMQTGGPRTRLQQMDGTDLKFPDKSFDLVISANVMEHVSNPCQYISEASRVTRRTGIAYFETSPVWTSARGHHLHADMVAENCPLETAFTDDGSVVPDWSHLTYDRDQMRRQLETHLLPETVNYVLWFLFDSGDLNKAPWASIRSYLESNFPYTRIKTWETPNTNSALMPTDNADNYMAGGFSAVCRKSPQNRLTYRLAWRLRKLGL